MLKEALEEFKCGKLSELSLIIIFDFIISDNKELTKAEKDWALTLIGEKNRK